MKDELKLAVSRQIDGIEFDCYVKQGQVDPQDFWATREQIGLLLEYEHPATAIKNIHERNKERLDKFSTQLKMSQVEGKRTVLREVIMYNFKGLLEICRYSQQPKANAVIDVLWDIADEIRRTGSYSAKAKRSRYSLTSFKAAKVLIDKAVRCKTSADVQSVTALDRLFQDNYGYSVLEVGELDLPDIQPEPISRDEELWQHIVSTFAPNEWFTSSALSRTLALNTLSIRQVRWYISKFVAKKMLRKRGNNKGSEYIRNR